MQDLRANDKFSRFFFASNLSFNDNNNDNISDENLAQSNTQPFLSDGGFVATYHTYDQSSR